MTLTPFWHRRICEAIAVFCLLIIGLYAWTVTSSIGVNSEFYVSPLAAGISVGAIILAALSYFVVPENFRSATVYAAYWVLLFAIGALNLTTGAGNSPFISTWMIAAMFAGIFGRATLAILFLGLNTYAAYIFINGDMTQTLLLSIALAGELPLIVSFILWHGKSNTEKTKERAYYDLANELEATSNKAEVVINAISDGVIAVNNQGQIELINPAAQRIVGWGHQDALNLDYKSVLQMLTKDGNELEKATDPVFEVLSTNQPMKRNDLQLQTNSGKKLNIEVVVSPIGRIGSGAIIVFRDVTKEQEEERAQAEFISTASHEMRTPVASIEGYLGLALNPATATIDTKARDYITKAHEAAQHLGHLLQDLLDVTKAEDGRLSNNPKVINVVEFTDDIVVGLQQKAKEKNIRLFFKPMTSSDGGLRSIEPVYFVDLDADHLREVLSNLIENGIKYTPQGQVVVDVKGDDSHVVITITDSGIGIPAEDIPHLFQKFYRVDNSDTREIGGTGLGLYLCRRLVEAMGGRIWVDSEYKKGSTFSVELPRISHEEATRLIEAANAETIRPSKVKTPLAATPTEGNDNELTEDQFSQALSTPIILNRTPMPALDAGGPVPTSATATAPPVTVDPLVGNSQTAESREPLRPHGAMVIPPSMQAVKSNLQLAAQPAADTMKPSYTPQVTPNQPAPAPVTPPAATVQPTATVPQQKPGSLPQNLQTIQPTLQPKPQAPPVVAARPISVPERQQKP